MKKSILAISTAAAIGGMGFASTAHAVYYFGNSANETYAGIVMGGLFGVSHTTYRANATGVALNEAGVGNYLFTPYFSTQKDATSAINTSTHGNFGYNNRHRWTRPAQLSF